MSVSFVVPVWRQDVYEKVSRPWLQDQVERYGAELIESRGASGIFEAYEAGRERARHDLVMYVHDDVRLLGPADLTAQIVAAFARYPKLGVLGPVGKVSRARVPWWLNSGNYVGHWFRRGKNGQLVYQHGDERGKAPYVGVTGNDPAEFWKRHRPRWDRFATAGLVDGFFLIESKSRMTLPWDVKTYGPQWHGYDVDRCFQAHSLGLDVMVSPWLFLHDNAGHSGYKGTDRGVLHNRRDGANRETKTTGDAAWLADLDMVNGLVRRKWGCA